MQKKTNLYTLSSSQSKAKSIRPPSAPLEPRRLVTHRDVRIDPYFWMKDVQHPETLPYLKAENKYFENQMKPLQGLKNKLFGEMKRRIQENETSVPVKEGAYFYRREYKKGQQYPMYQRRGLSEKKYQTVLDLNALAKGKKHLAISGLDVSPNSQLLAYGVEFDGSERYTVYVRDLVRQKNLSIQLQDCSGSIAWGSDNQTIFYVKLDQNHRPYQVYRHRLGERQSQDVLVFEEKDPQYFVSVIESLSRDFIYIHTGGKISDEVWYLSNNDLFGKFKCLEPRKMGLEYSVSDRDGEFWILTNLNAENFQLMKTSIRRPGKKHWKPVVRHRQDTLLTQVHLFKDQFVVSEFYKGLPQIRIFDAKHKSGKLIELPEKVCTVSVGDNREFQTQVLRLQYSAPIIPESTLEYDFHEETVKILQQKKVKGHREQSYVCERVFVKSHDGAQVPLTLVYKKGFKKQAQAPGYLYGYGSYGMSMPDGFPGRREIFRLVDRGFVYALAHPRGGSEMGRQWYEDGKFLKKKNTFLDFIACAEYLKKKKWIHPKKLAICGGSAGGMLVGACMNMRPDLFDVVAAHVPFVDVINTMLDENLPLTQLEYKEWGDPGKDKKYYNYMKSYSPYDNVWFLDYPALFVTCGLNDPRVTYWEPAKWVAKIREFNTGHRPILFKTNMGAGHGGASGRFNYLYEVAEEFAFILDQFGIKR